MKKNNGVTTLNIVDVPFVMTDDVTNCTLHKHDFYELSVTVKDGYYHTVNGLDVFPTRGDVIVLRPGDIHRLSLKGDESAHGAINIAIPESLFNEVCSSVSKTLLSRICSMSQPPMFHIPEQTLEAFAVRFANPLYRVTERLVPADRLRLFRQIRQCFAYEIIGYFIMGESSNEVVFPPCISAVLAAVDDEANAHKSISRIAEDIGYSPSYLSRQFRRQFNFTLEQFFISQKLIKAKNMLVNTDESVEKIGTMYGWSKPGSFIRAFKGAYGISPGRFRADMKKDASGTQAE